MGHRPKHRRRIIQQHKQIQFRLRRGEVYCILNRCTDAPPPVQRCAGANGSPVSRNAPRGAQFAHEPLRTTRPSGGGWGEEISPRRAPDGAAAEFEELRQLWQRPYGMNVAKALAAFNRVTGDDDTRRRSFSKVHGAGWRRESQPTCRRWSGGWTTAHGETNRRSAAATVTTNQAPQRWPQIWRAKEEGR